MLPNYLENNELLKARMRLTPAYEIRTTQSLELSLRGLLSCTPIIVTC